MKWRGCWLEMHGGWRRILPGSFACLVVLGTLVGVASAAPVPASTATVWLCRPGLAGNPCTSDLTTTAVQPDGSQTVQRTAAAENAPIDCFCVYPTVSPQQTPNASLNIDPEETEAAKTEAARFSQTCRVFAPMYPQYTRAAAQSGADTFAQAVTTAYNGVLSAWHDYLTHYNHGRGVVFIGHSQGATMLTQMLRSEIDPTPTLRRRLVSALLIGGNVTVNAGGTVGGSFEHIPACHATSQTGCVVAYSSFDNPPPANSIFGRVGQGVGLTSDAGNTANLHVLCVNPASPSGGTGALQSYFRTKRFPGYIGAISGPVPAAPTPYVEYPQLYTATCQQANGATWLQVNDIGASSDQRFRVTATPSPTWGLHLFDMNLPLGNLVHLVQLESAANHH